MEPCRGHLPWGASCVAGRTLSGRASPTPAPLPRVEWSLALSQSGVGLRPLSRGVWSGGQSRLPHTPNNVMGGPVFLFFSLQMVFFLMGIGRWT